MNARTESRIAPLFSSAKQDWGTPRWLFEELHAEFDFTVDLCAHQDNAKLPSFIPPPWHHPCGPITAAQMLRADAFERTWWGRGFLNPEYGRGIGRWTARAAQQVNDGLAELVVGLVAARTDTVWWNRDVIGHAEEVRLIEGRLKFEGGDGKAPFPSAVVVWRKHRRTPRFITINARGRA